jgi:succinate dehydrogenase / fumarate reductase cytochrome b subunit
VAHRITGVALFFFLFAPVIDTATVRVSPEAYNTAPRPARAASR